MPFKKSAAAEPVPASPEALYPVLPRRQGAPKELWSRQADVLRAYNELSPMPADVAIELPTGAGKTLVGCLIAEWRRRKYGDRVAYVAPTRQLANQAAARADLYGIPSVDLTGSHRKWSPADEAAFNLSNVVAFVTYNAIFNTNPHIEAHTLILDDAHAAEAAVAANWSVHIRRNDLAFPEVVDLLARAGAITENVVHRLRLDDSEGDSDDGGSGPGVVYLAGMAQVADAAGDLERILEDAAKNNGMQRSSAFALEMVTGSLPACMTYVSRREILIRPLIAPTRYQDAFTSARHRVYMSATLGDGGELERAFGKRKIARVPVPARWETQGTGRRFFVFPDLLSGLDKEDGVADFAFDVIAVVGKAVLIAPSGYACDRAVTELIPEEMPLWATEDYEAAPDDFAEAQDGVLALANRYDGIDLPDGACRLVVLAGLPVGAHLQERFLHESVGATAVLTERMRTRVAQGAGRATRNSTDFAAVLMLDRKLATFCAQAEVQAANHPELRAEIAFGLENSRGVPAHDARENLSHFLDQDKEWREADKEIIAARESAVRERPPGGEELAASAPHEVAAWDAAWQGDWAKAISEAGKALAAIASGEEIRHYRSLWHYIQASWAVISDRARSRPELRSLADSHFADARAAATGTRWLAELATSADALLAGQSHEVLDPVDAAAVSRIASSAFRGKRETAFSSFIKGVQADLRQTEAKQFERALAGLGELAGAEVPTRAGESAEPDSVWMFDSQLWVALEAKSDCRPDGEVSATNAREADGHLNFTSSSTGSPVPPGSFAVIVTPQQDIHRAAARVATARLYLSAPDVLVDLADRLGEAWIDLRVQTRNLEPDEARPIIQRALRAARALPSQWLPGLTTRRVADG